jgi:hypothetical protein
MLSYFTNVGHALDKFLNAATGGAHYETVSERAARAELKGKKWGCYLCRWLHYTVESRHCQKTLEPGVPTKTAACIKALVQMVVVVWACAHLYGLLVF